MNTRVKISNFVHFAMVLLVPVFSFADETGDLAFLDDLLQPIGLTYPAGSSDIYLEVADPDLNTDPLSVQICQVTCESELGDSEVIQLTETGLNTGIFQGTLPFDPQVLAAAQGYSNDRTPILAEGDGSLQVLPGDILTATYQDALNDWGAAEEVQAESLYGGYMGTVSGTWTASGGPYVVVADIYVNDTLVVEAGVDVEFMSGVKCVVSGTLDCRGAAGDSVRFLLNESATMPPDATWYGVRGSVGFSGDVLMSYTSVRNAYRGLWVGYGGLARLDHSSFSENTNVGFMAENCDSVRVADSVFHANPQTGMYIYSPLSGGAIIDNCEVQENGDGIKVRLSASQTTINQTLISENDRGIYFESASGTVPTPVVNGCSFDGNGSWDIMNLTSKEINARYNTWGPTATAEMNAGGNPKDISTIYDVYDDPGRGLVNYSSWDSGSGVFGASAIISFQSDLGQPIGLTYPAGSSDIYLEVADSDLNTDPLSVQTCQVTCESEFGDSEIVQLLETDPNTGIFQGTLPFDPQVLAAAQGYSNDRTPILAEGDGSLQVLPGDILTATYQDALNDWGAAEEVQAESLYGGYMGTVSGTWTASGGPYVVVADIYVNDTLVVEAGVDVEFMSGVKCVVSGTLDCRGAAGDSVRFLLNESATMPPDATWYGVRGSVGFSGDVLMSYTSVRNAYRGLWVGYGGLARLDHSSFSENTNVGFMAENCDSVRVADSVFHANPQTGMYIYSPLSGGAIIDNCEVQENGDGIKVRLSASQTTINQTLISENDRGIYFESASGTVPTPVVNGCSFDGNGSWDIMNLTSKEINARYNTWGPTATAEMNAGGNPKDISTIYDVYDDPGRGLVNYSSWDSGSGVFGASAIISFQSDLGQPIGLTYPPGSTTLYLEVADSDLNTDSGSLQTCQVTCESELGDSEVVQLTETGSDSGVFRGSIPFDPQVFKAFDQITEDFDLPPEDRQKLFVEAQVCTNDWAPALVVGDGSLQLIPGNILTATYQDILNDWGASEEIQAESMYGGYMGAVSGTWTAAGGPYVIVGDIQINDTLVVESGVDVEFMEDVVCWVSGTLDCRGAAGDSVRFLLKEGAGVPPDADWNGIVGANFLSGDVLLSYTSIRNAVRGVWIRYGGAALIDHCTMSETRTGLLVDNSDSTQVTDSVFRDNSFAGIDIYGINYGGVLIDGCEVQNNPTGIGASPSSSPITITQTLIAENSVGIYLFTYGSAMSPVVNGCNFIGNTDWDIINSTSEEISARFNYWGEATTAEMNAGGNPKDISTIYDLYDDPSRGPVNYSQWLQYPPEIDWCLPEPTQLTATWNGVSAIQLTWVDNSTSESGFAIDRRLADSSSWSNVAAVLPDVEFWSDPGVSEGNTYFYRVRALRTSGCYAVSNVASATAILAPVAPAGLVAAPLPEAGISLTWNDASSNEHGFEIQRRTTEKSDWSDIETRPGAGSESYSDSDIAAATEFFYRVRSYIGEVFSAWSEQAGATTNGEPSGFDPFITVTFQNEEVEGASLYIDSRDGNGFQLQPGTTDADGRIQLLGVGVNDRIRAQKMVKARKSEKKGHSQVDDRMYELWVDSDRIASSGSYSPIRIANTQSNVALELVHPVFRYNLVVSVQWDLSPSDPYWTQIRDSFNKASDHLYDSTDGQVQLGKVAVYDNKKRWKRADMRIYQLKSSGEEPEWPHVNNGVGGIFDDKYWWTQTPRQIHFSRTFKENNPDHHEYYRAIAHEFGHYGLSFWDEYLNGNGEQAAWTNYRSQHPDEVPQNFGIMDKSYSTLYLSDRHATELSSSSEYLNSYSDPLDPEKVSMQFFMHRMSCWEWLSHFLEGEYPGITVATPLPGWYPDNRSNPRTGPDVDIGMASGGLVVVDDDKSAPSPVDVLQFDSGPGSISVELQISGVDGQVIPNASAYLLCERGLIYCGKTDQVGEIEIVGIQPGDEVKVLPETGKLGPGIAIRAEQLRPGQRTTLTIPSRTSKSQAHGASDSRAPGLLLDARPIGSADSPRVHLEMWADEPLSDSPNVTGYYGAWSGQVTVTSVPAEGRYLAELSVDVSDTLFDGLVVFEVSATDTTGNVQTTIGRCMLSVAQADMQTDIHSGVASFYLSGNNFPEARLTSLLDYDSGQFSVDGFPGVPITNGFSVHTNEDDLFVDGATFNVAYADSMVLGYDETELSLMRWNAGTQGWDEIPNAEFGIAEDAVSAAIDRGGVYCVFAMQASADIVAPGRVVDLGAVGTVGHGSIILSWSAPGDDYASGSASEYSVAFSDSLITIANWDYLPKIPGVQLPSPAGSPENLAIVVPQSGQLYYFAIRAKDEAGNLANLSNVATAVSGVHDPNSLPGPPTSVRAIDRDGDTGGVILVSWSSSYDDGGGKGTVDSYRVFRNSPPDNLPVLLGVVPSGTTDFADSTVQDGAVYTYWVSASDGSQESLGNTEEGLSAINVGAPIGDFTSDGIVGIDDLCIFVDAFGTGVGSLSFDPLYDLNGNGTVETDDFLQLSSSFGTGGEPSIIPQGDNDEAEVFGRIVTGGGDLWHLDVFASGVDNIAGYSFRASYPNESLAFVGASSDNSVPGGNFLNEQQAQTPLFLVDTGVPGTVSIANAIKNPTSLTTPGGDGYLGRLSFSGPVWDGIEVSSIILMDGERRLNLVAHLSGVDDQAPLPFKPRLLNCYPNPFNAEVVIEYELPQRQMASLRIYDLRGRLVTDLVRGVEIGGRHRVTWNGRDSAGRSVASGVYFYRLHTDGLVQTKKMLLVK